MAEIKEPELSTEQQSFIDRAIQGENIFLTGKAGTGKSTVVRRAIKQLKDQKKRVVALAPTGIAANNIGGQTIHSMFSLDPHGVLDPERTRFFKGEKRRIMNLVDVIVIDEVSMLRPDMLDAMNWTLIKNGCRKLTEMQIIFVGDLKQLEPPIDDNMKAVLLQTYDGVEFFEAQVYASLNVQNVELQEVHRQDNIEFIDNLNIIREGGKSEYFRQFVHKEAHGIVLAPHNSTVARYNFDGLRSVEGKEYVYTAIVSGNARASEFNLEPEVRVKEGCKIMHLVNSKSDNDLINGTIGTFAIKDGKPYIDVNGIKYKLDPVELQKKEYVLNSSRDGLELREIGSITQIPIKLAYALTIHKSQGLTFEAVTIDLSQPCFSSGMMYVALSRVTAPEGLRIIVNR